jgi:hypothetical protein
MTCLEKLARANRWRIRTGKFASDDSYAFNGQFLVPLEGEMFLVQLSDGWGWRHLSVSNAQRRVLPTWSVITRLRDLFFPDDVWVVQMFPPKEEYVNDCPWCLHLWESLDEPMPHPSVVMV